MADKHKGGRPKKEFTEKEWAQIENACEIQCTGEEIAHLLGVDYKTVERRVLEKFGIGFGEYIKKHSASGKTSLRRLQYRAAENGSVPMLIWLGKQYLGQSDKQHTEQQYLDANGNPTNPPTPSIEIIRDADKAD